MIHFIRDNVGTNLFDIEVYDKKGDNGEYYKEILVSNNLVCYTKWLRNFERLDEVGVGLVQRF